MKLRIRDNSIRFRITPRELDTIRTQGGTHFTAPMPGGSVSPCGAVVDPIADEANVRVEPPGPTQLSCPPELASPANTSPEGVRIRREFRDESVTPQRPMALSERDRPGAICDNPEARVYQETAGPPPETRPIPWP